jgi:TatD DNase family protein
MTSPAPALIDSHAHLDSGKFESDRAATIQRAEENGISHILTIGCDLDSSAKSVAIAAQFPQVYAAVGVHPHAAEEINTAGIERLEQLLAQPKVVALGEIGLDYFRDRSPRDIQREAFRRQIRLARQVNKPIIVHDRDAHDEVLQILIEEDGAQVGGVLHCFSGDRKMAQQCLDLGFYLSFPGPVTYPKNDFTRDVVRSIPIERLLVETDCPYLAPQPFRGQRNEPAYVRATAEKIAALKGLSLADVARITSRNCRQLFGFGPEDQDAKIAYPIRDSLYLNITNRCTNRCVFCAKFSHGVVKGHPLQLKKEPTAAEVKAAIGDPKNYREIVFCGYGEPLLRLDLVKEIAGWLQKQHVRVRVNTDGLGNLVHQDNILLQLSDLVDAVSVSLNAANATDYQAVCQSSYGESAYQAVIDFIREARTRIPEVVATAVSYPGIDIAACEQVAEELGVPFRAREYQPIR